jgi:cystinosin
MADYEYLQTLSTIVGWTYFIAWSVSFYPQCFLNYRRKSVDGFSIEFAILNVSGFFFYSMYSVGGFIYPNLGTGTIQPNDLFFALHAFCIGSVQLTQVFIYDRGKQKTFQTWAVYLLVIEWTVFITLFVLEGLLGVRDIPSSANTFKIAGYAKALITLFKYCPQVYLNWSRQSTVGWSIFNIMCDFTGGFFSTAQQFIDMAYKGMTSGDWAFFGDTGTFNIIKFLLGILSIVFDLIFMVQHFCLYRNQEPEDDTIEMYKPIKQPLLPQTDNIS